MADHLLRMLAIDQTEPHGHGGQNAGLIDRLAVGAERERVGVRTAVRAQPELLFQRVALGVKLGIQILCAHGVVEQAREHGQRSQRLHVAACLIELHTDGEQRTAFHPSVTHVQIARETGFVERGSHEVKRFPEPRRLFAGERYIAAGAHVFGGGDDVERRSVRGSEAVGKLLEPIHQAGGLRDFVRNFAIVALEMRDELDGGARIGEIAGGGERERGPERIAPEKPGKSWPVGAF